MINPLSNALASMAKRIEEIQDTLPPSWTEGEDRVTDEMVARIRALEEEWIIDPDRRKEFSGIQDEDE